MSYQGLIAHIPFGVGGLMTDVPQTLQSPTTLVRAISTSPMRGFMEKEPGSKRWNVVGLGTGIRGIYDWWPNYALQRVIVVGANGKVYRFTNIESSSEITASGSAPATLNASDPVTFVSCGHEQSGNNRKLFVFTGKDPVQVISGDGTTRTNISQPAADWSGSNQPSFGIVHRNAVWAFGNSNQPHRIYRSNPDNHEQFVTNVVSMNIYPGNGERLINAFVYKTRLFVVKFPLGLYVLNDDDASSANWFWSKVNDSFGGISENCSAQVLDDIIIANSYNSITSLAASDSFGDVESADVFASLQCEQFVKDEMAQDVPSDRHVLYYPEKKQVFVTWRSKSNLQQNRMAVGDLTLQSPRVTWNFKDQPNVLGMIRDIYGIMRPVYGAEDGYVYMMDQQDREVEGLKPPRQMPTLARGGSSGNLSNGKYRYGVTFYDPSTGKETTVGPIANGISISFTFVDADVSTGGDTITETDHGLANGTQVVLSTTGVLPTGLSSFQTYYVIGRTTNTFQLSLTSGGGAVDITAASGGGTHTLRTEVDQEFQIFDNTVNGRASLTNIPVDPNGTSGIQRRIYRNKISDQQTLYLLATIADNTTTTYSDNIADASLGTDKPPESNEFSSGYTSEFQTPHMDFSSSGIGVQEKLKSYDFFELCFEPTGEFDLFVDVFVDGILSRTLRFQISGRSDLDTIKMDSNTLDPEVPRSQRQPLNLSGRRISFKMYNNEIKKNYRLLSGTVYYRLLDEGQRK